MSEDKVLIDIDEPILYPSEDLFNRGKFIEKVSNVIEQEDDKSFVIGLYGKWGSGKTSIINLICKRLECGCNNNKNKFDGYKENIFLKIYNIFNGKEKQSTNVNNKIIVLKFNPWICSNKIELIRQFFDQLSNILKIKVARHRKLIQALNEYKESILAAFRVTGGESLTNIFSGILSFLNAGQQVNTLERYKKIIVEEIHSLKQKIVVIIDDIDRLSDEEVAMIFQLVKAIADFPYMTYVLVFDHEIIVNALDRVQRGKGKEYLKKIVQVPILVPEVEHEVLEAQFFKFLNNTLSEEDKQRLRDCDRWNLLFENGINHYLTSLRDVKLYCNTIKIRYVMAHDDFDIIDTLGLACLQTFEKNVYDKIYKYGNKLCHDSYIFEIRDGAKARVQNAFKKIIEGCDFNPHTENILSSLFPGINKYIENNIYGYDNYRYDLLPNKSISYHQNFYRYFLLGLASRDISQNEIYNFLLTIPEDKLERVLMTYNENNQLKNFFRMIINIGDFKENKINLPKERVNTVIKALLSKADEYNLIDYSISPRVKYYLVQIIEKIINMFPDDDKFNFMTEIWNDERININTLALLLYHLREIVSKKQNEESEHYTWISKENVEFLEDQYMKRGYRVLKNKEFCRDGYKIDFIILMEEIDPNSLKYIKEKLNQDDRCIIKGIEFSLRHVYLSSKPYHRIRLDKTLLDKYIGSDRGKDIANKYINSSKFNELSEEGQKILVAFIIWNELAPSSADRLEGISSSMIDERIENIKNSLV